MNLTFLFILVGAVVALGLLFWFFQRETLKKLQEGQAKDNSFLLLQQQMDTLREHLRQNLDGSSQIFSQRMHELSQQITEHLKNQGTDIQKTHQTVGELIAKSHETVGSRLDNAARVVGELQGRLGKLEESNQRIFEVGKDIASLQEILRAPKLRGNLGELFLGDLLSQVLPLEHFELQYGFKNGEKVDAVVKLAGNLVPIDSKFPLENFRKFLEANTEVDKKNFRKIFLSDVKKHIDSIASKYIQPGENTFDFALMYIPAENVYYEMVIREEAFDSEFSILNHAMAKRVIPVSPNNFYVYLNTILLGLRGMKIEQSAREIQISLGNLHKDLGKFAEDFGKVGKHLSNARSAYEEADKRLNRFSEKIEGIALPSTEQEPLKQVVGGG